VTKNKNNRKQQASRLEPEAIPKSLSAIQVPYFSVLKIIQEYFGDPLMM